MATTPFIEKQNALDLYLANHFFTKKSWWYSN